MCGIEGLVRQGIEERRPLAVEYRRRGQGLRTVHPHLLYRTSTGRVYVDTYQVDGYTSSGELLPAWRAFDLRQLVHAELVDGSFSIAPGYNPTAAKYGGRIIAAV